KAKEQAIQILGGNGDTRKDTVEQYYRDNRRNPIHEGTEGIQSLDLLGRKLAQNNGAGLKQLIRRLAASDERASQHPRL
uniref:acyl-CoA dehydrogenase family protein n=1 Tax=Pseudomonas urethralis TaxID=2740517 RepID=UPI00249F6D86